jgi:hypothetical protein
MPEKGLGGKGNFIIWMQKRVTRVVAHLLKGKRKRGNKKPNEKNASVCTLLGYD